MKEEKLIKEVAEAPAKALEKTVEAVDAIHKQKPIRIAKKYWGTLGPGLTTGASDDDPSGIATYSQSGAQFGFSHIWLSLYAIPFMIVVQEMCARIAQVTGRGISGVIKQHYGKPLLYFTVLLLFIANSINIGADIAGMAAGAQLLMPNLPYGWLAIFFAVLSLWLEIWIPYAKYANFLKYLTLVLFAYIITVFFIQVDWQELAIRTLIPSFSFSEESLFMVMAIIGTTISPYLFYWQASQEIEQQKEVHDRTTLAELKGTNKEEISAMRKDVATGMIFSNIVMFFIIAVTGTILFSQGLTISTAADAAKALEPLAGNYASLLFAVGIIGTGLLAIPVLAGSASYAFAEAFSLNHGLDKSLKQAHGFYGIIILSILIGLGINFLGIDPIKALIGSAVVNGLVAPVLLTLILLVANNGKIMGDWKNGAWSNALGWLIAIIMYIAGAFTIYGFF